jgi:hypothetical protein
VKVARFAAAVFAVLAVAGCGGRAATASGASHPATARPSSLAPAASPSSDGAAFCARVKAAVDPETAYLSAVIDRDNLISTFSTASPADNERAARAEVAGWIAVYCPKYAYLTKSS